MKKYKYYLIYKITNRHNNMTYIGQHCTNKLDDAYMGSGTLITSEIKTWKKKGHKVEEKFSKEILHVFDNFLEMNRMEMELVDEDFVDDPMTYNYTLGGSLGTHPSQQYKLLMPQTPSYDENLDLDDLVSACYTDIMDEINNE